MPASYTCKCQDGRSLSGTAKWTNAEMQAMSPEQSAQALSEIREFARYYSSNFYIPRSRLEDALGQLLHRYQKARRCAIALGLLTAVCTTFWIILALIPATRFAPLTMCMAVLTFCSIIGLIPVLFWFISSQEEYSKKYPRTLSKLEQLNQEQEKEIFGTYVDYLVTGFVLTPEYSLFEEGLDFMIKMLHSKRASSIPQAEMMCRKKLGKSPVPKIILSVSSSSQKRSVSPAANTSSVRMYDAAQLDNASADLQTILQLTDYLHSAVQDYASQAAVSTVLAETESALTMEEKEIVTGYRSLSEKEKIRVRRIIHSFLSGQY